MKAGSGFWTQFCSAVLIHFWKTHRFTVSSGGQSKKSSCRRPRLQSKPCPHRNPAQAVYSPHRCPRQASTAEERGEGLSTHQPCSPAVTAACSRASVHVVTEAGPKAGHRFENMDFSSLKLSWKCPACQRQRPTLSPHVAPSPGGLPNHLAEITLDAFPRGGAVTVQVSICLLCLKCFCHDQQLWASRMLCLSP